MENNKLIDFHSQSPLQAIAHQPWWNIEWDKEFIVVQ
jgi:hypothetical protein